MITFFVPGQPVAKARARSTAAGIHYTPAKTRNYERRVAAHCKMAMEGKEMINGPACIEITLYMPIPASWTRAKREQAASGEIPHTKKPDIDNCVKSIKDALNGIAWRDDSQVVSISARKHYSNEPGACVTVMAV